VDRTHLCREIVGLQRQIGRILGQHAAGVWISSGLSVTQLKSLFLIAEKGSTNFRGLAETLGVTPSNVTRIIERLVEQGLVSRTENPEDLQAAVNESKVRLLLGDEAEAGKLLAEALFEYRRVPGLLVLGLPRGGVPVAYEIAVALGSELDVIVVRKLGVPSQPELALGAIASGGVIVLNSEVVGFMEITDEQIRSVRAAEQQELMRREHQYRGNKPLWEAADRTVIIVDDGLATGASMKAAVTIFILPKKMKLRCMNYSMPLLVDP